MSHDNRTLEPTAKRRQQAQLEGNVAVSGQVTAAVVWLAVAATMFFTGRRSLVAIKMLFKETWDSPASNAEGLMIVDRLTEAVLLAGRITIPVLAIMVLAAFIGRIAQVGSVWAPQRLLPKVNRVNFSSRLGDLLSAGQLCQVGLWAGMIVGGFAFASWGIWSQRSELMGLLAVPVLETELLQWATVWGLRLGILLAAFAIVDYAYQRYRFELSLRMSPQELRAEIKAVEGNPQIANGRRDMQREIRTANSSERSA